MQKNRFYLLLVCIISIFCSLMLTSYVEAKPSIVVKGYVFIDGTITQPEIVNLTFDTQSANAVIYDKGYLMVFAAEKIGKTGEFYIVYNKTIYIPPEKVTILENQYIYDIDLHINTSDGGQPYIEPVNIEPVSNPGGPYFERIGVSIQFNGTKSIDPDGSIVKYEWDFGDKSTATEATPIHVYRKLGNFTVTLKVTDNDGNSTQNSTYAVITKTLNYPPDKPQINGSTTGNINTDYNFTLQAIDPDDDEIQYSINWSDKTKITTTELLKNGTIATVVHNWTEPGIYTIKAYAIDEKDALSEKSELVILIDTIYCQDLGYLIDKTGDGIYNFIYLNSSGLETLVVFENGPYLIDVDNDGEYDYQFNTISNDLSVYAEAETKKQETNLIDTIKPYLPYMVVFLIIILLIIIMFIVIGIIKQKPKKEKIFYIKRKDEIIEKKTISKEKGIITKEERIKAIEEKVDELLSKRR